MITIGIRAAPKAVTFVIYDSDAHRIDNVEEIVVPAAFSTPDRLKYIRSNILDVLREYRVQRAGIRETEPSSQSLSVDRIQMEGVIQEAFASSNLESYYVGHISNISSRNNISRSDFKPLIEGKTDFGVEGWSKMTSAAREAVLCAIGAVDA